MLETALIERLDWEMPSDRPFNLNGVKRLLAKEATGNIFDVFPYGPKINIEDRIKAQASASYDTVLIDGPYSTRQAQGIRS